MPDEPTIYREELVQTIDVPPADDLVQGVTVASEIRISTAGEYKRGELMMSSGDNEFTSATKAGLASASEICILCHDCEIPEGKDYFTAAYFTGTFNADRIILSYETEANDHAALIEEVKTYIRRRAIFLN